MTMRVKSLNFLCIEKQNFSVPIKLNNKKKKLNLIK